MISWPQLLPPFRRLGHWMKANLKVLFIIPHLNLMLLVSWCNTAHAGLAHVLMSYGILYAQHLRINLSGNSSTSAESFAVMVVWKKKKANCQIACLCQKVTLQLMGRQDLPYCMCCLVHFYGQVEKYLRIKLTTVNDISVNYPPRQLSRDRNLELII